MSSTTIIDNIELEREKSVEISTTLTSTLLTNVNKFINTFKGLTDFIKHDIVTPVKSTDKDTYDYYISRLKEYSKIVTTMESSTHNVTGINYKGSAINIFIDSYGQLMKPLTEYLRKHDITLFDIEVYTPFKQSSIIIPNTHLDYTVLWSDRQLKVTDAHKRKVLVYLGLLQKLQENCSDAYNSIVLEVEYQNARGDEMITVGASALNNIIDNVTEDKEDIQYFTNLLIDELRKERIAPSTVLKKLRNGDMSFDYLTKVYDKIQPKLKKRGINEDRIKEVFTGIQQQHISNMVSCINDITPEQIANMTDKQKEEYNNIKGIVNAMGSGGDIVNELMKLSGVMN